MYFTLISIAIYSFAMLIWHLTRYHIESEGYAYSEDIHYQVHLSCIHAIIGGICIGAAIAL